MSSAVRIMLLLALVAMRFLGISQSSAAADPVAMVRPLVAPPEQSRLFFRQQPLDTVQDHLILPGVAVRIEDADGKPVPNVPVTLTSDHGLLRGITTVMTDVRGVARFDTLVISKPGSYMLQARAGSLPRVASAAFAVFSHEAESAR